MTMMMTLLLLLLLSLACLEQRRQSRNTAGAKKKKKGQMRVVGESATSTLNSTTPMANKAISCIAQGAAA